MKTIEQIKKIESVVLYVLKKFPEGVDYIKLFKIIYLAQKEYLANYGKVLCPDTFKARTFGPVPALSDKVIKMAELEEDDIASFPDLKEFCNSIRVQNQLVFAKDEPDMDYLSIKECVCLDKWYDYCKDKDSKEELSPKSHDEAYRKAYARYKKDPQLGTLTNLEIAKAGNATESMLAYIKEKELLVTEFS
ncbi:MAG: SocA family protein [Bacteroidaceae bacterium]|nr:SocA family protein [Bacteroidaceae bacterium]